MVDIHRVYGLFLPYFRKKRFQTFIETIRPGLDDKILDVGGYPDNWTSQPVVARGVDVLNLDRTEFDERSAPAHNLRTLAGDGTNLQFGDSSYDIVFSNSVIEHVGDFDAQRRFAEENRRVGGRLWVQTPAKEFFFEPHFLTPFFHWLPVATRKQVGRFTLWALISHPSPEQVEALVDEVRLLTRSEMETLFPDCEIRRERFLGVFTKSHIAVRT